MAEPEAQDERTEQLKAALWLSTGRLVDEICQQLGPAANATPHFIAALTEMIWVQIQTAGQDIEAFAKHAGRTTVTTNDILLLARRNQELEQILKKGMDPEAATRQAIGNGKGKRN